MMRPEKMAVRRWYEAKESSRGLPYVGDEQLNVSPTVAAR
jgi:hypothetical protein